MATWRSSGRLPSTPTGWTVCSRNSRRTPDAASWGASGAPSVHREARWAAEAASQESRVSGIESFSGGSGNSTRSCVGRELQVHKYPYYCSSLEAAPGLQSLHPHGRAAFPMRKLASAPRGMVSKRMVVVDSGEEETAGPPSSMGREISICSAGFGPSRAATTEWRGAGDSPASHMHRRRGGGDALL